MLQIFQQSLNKQKTFVCFETNFVRQEVRFHFSMFALLDICEKSEFYCNAFYLFEGLQHIGNPSKLSRLLPNVKRREISSWEFPSEILYTLTIWRTNDKMGRWKFLVQNSMITVSSTNNSYWDRGVRICLMQEVELQYWF